MFNVYVHVIYARVYAWVFIFSLKSVARLVGSKVIQGYATTLGLKAMYGYGPISHLELVNFFSIDYGDFTEFVVMANVTKIEKH